MAIIKEKGHVISNVGKDFEKLDFSYTADGNVK